MTVENYLRNRSKATATVIGSVDDQRGSEVANKRRKATPSEQKGSLERHKRSSVQKRRSPNSLERVVNEAKSQLKWCMIGLAIFGVGVMVPGTRTLLRPLFEVQYVDHTINAAAKGRRDIGLVITAVLVLVALRAFVQLTMLRAVLPLTSITKPKAGVRFAEQGWCAVYYTSATVIGIMLLRQEDYGWDPHQLWQKFPHYYMHPLVKMYYLTALGFWVSQVYIINIEERRSDHWQMFIHHLVACALVAGSYAYSYTRVGHLVLILMDSVDIFLSGGKVLKYIGVPTFICDPLFFMFLLSWVSLRHIVYDYQIWWGLVYAPPLIEGNCTVDPSTGETLACFNYTAHYAFAALAASLQLIMCIWLVMIFRVVIRVLNGHSAEDSRSDDEDESVDDHIYDTEGGNEL